jgi:glutaredoxin-like protein NrdH
MTEIMELLDKLMKNVDGQNDKHDVTIYTLSTCQWCKRCKAYLNDKNIKYKYIDVDLVSQEEKAKIMQYIRDHYKPDRMAYPFLVCDGKFVVGYDPNKYEELFTKGD